MNLVFALAMLGGSSALVWAGITDPAGGLVAGLRNAMSGQPNAKRSVTGAAFLSGLTVENSSAGGGVSQTSTTGAASGRRAALVATARTWLGVKYVWGGTTRAGVDCSGLMLRVYGANGITLPRVSAAQALRGTRTTTPQPGDLVAFGAPVHHIGIVIGADSMIHAPNSRGVVRVESIAGCARAMRAPVQYRNLLGASTQPATTGGTVQT